MKLALIAAGVIALLVFLVLPKLIPSSKQVTESQQLSTEAPAGIDVASLRAPSQNLLAEVQGMQRRLEQLSVNRWAQASYATAVEAVSRAEVAHKKGLYHKSVPELEAARVQLSDLESGLGERILGLQDKLIKAIEAFDVEAAEAAVEILGLLEPDNVVLISALPRLQNLPQLESLWQQAMTLKREDDKAKASQVLQQAAQMDSAHQTIAAELANLQALMLSENFKAAMAVGYVHLEKGTLDNARASFQQALAFRPDSQEAKDALAVADRRIQTRTIKALLAKAEASAQAEQWSQALASYQQVLAIDVTVDQALNGQRIAQSRLKLDGLLQSVIAQPLRLSSSSVFSLAEQAMIDAEKISSKGPRIQSQIIEVRRLVAWSQKEFPVNLVSDNSTNVEVYRVASLGPVSSTTLNLRPGRYVAVGYRRGYQDVRVEFVVDGRQTQTISVQCEERI
ncbi:MAG: hypothetical protein V7711_13565 [Pseudomonadales bacterium]